jgi:nicotinate-nucleotide--dimethylbenzimidazole phosphoribosyltransferase
MIINSTFSIEPLSKELESALLHKIDQKTKPLGALGMLETLALQVGKIQNSLHPELKNPYILVFAGDHGIARDGVSAYPQEVTYQMVMNFLAGGAAINVFSRQHNIGLKIVDAGVNFNFPPHQELIDYKIAPGTRSFLHEKAMNREQCLEAIAKGAELVEKLHADGCNVIGFGEMGIGNTAAASAIMSKICRLPIEDCVGRGTGVSDEQLQKKTSILREAMEKHLAVCDPLDILQTFGGFEIAQICGGMLRAASLKMLVLVDGFIASAAFLVAQALAPAMKDYAVLCHQSEEKGHQHMLEFLEMKPLLNINMRLGEGTGCAVAYPVIASAVAFLTEMASFESAGVSDKDTGVSEKD